MKKFTEGMNCSFQQLEIKTFGQFTLTFEELDQSLVVDFVFDEKLFVGKRLLIGQRNGVDFSVVDGVLKFHIRTIFIFQFVFFRLMLFFLFITFDFLAYSKYSIIPFPYIQFTTQSELDSSNYCTFQIQLCTIQIQNQLYKLIHSSMSVTDHEDINRMIIEYLKTNGMSKVADSMINQINNKYVNKKFKPFTKGVQKPRILQMKQNNYEISKRELNLRKDFKENSKKYKQIISASKNVFSVTINLVQMLSSFKESNKPEIAEMIETYKIQLAKYYKVVENEGKPEGEEPTEVVFYQHKNKLDRYVNDRNIDGICEVLLSFRVNALQIAPQLRKNLVYQLIRNDLFKIQENEGFDFLLPLLQNPNPKLRYAIIPLVSIVCSTLRGVEYITYKKNMSVVQKIIKIMLQEKNGSVIQRFCLALLQKCSVKQTVIPVFLEYDMVNWLMKLIRESLAKKIHHFSLDFGSALLANIIHAQSTLTTLSQDPEYAHHLMQSMLRLLKEKNIQVSILMHLLICLSYLSKEEYFKEQKQNCNFVERISDFVEYYSQINTSENQAAEIDKRTVLDLCAHMFHPKDVDLDNSESMQYNELKTEDRIREYENQQGQLIFQCFQDEV